MLCAAHRATSPPRSYSRWDGGQTRHCPSCGQDLALDRFPQDASGVPRSTCRACRLAANRRWKLAHRDEILAKRRAGYAETHIHGWREQRRRWTLTP